MDQVNTAKKTICVKNASKGTNINSFTPHPSPLSWEILEVNMISKSRVPKHTLYAFWIRLKTQRSIEFNHCRKRKRIRFRSSAHCEIDDAFFIWSFSTVATFLMVATIPRLLNHLIKHLTFGEIKIFSLDHAFKKSW